MLVPRLWLTTSWPVFKSGTSTVKYHSQITKEVITKCAIVLYQVMSRENRASCAESHAYPTQIFSAHDIREANAWCIAHLTRVMSAPKDTFGHTCNQQILKMCRPKTNGKSHLACVLSQQSASGKMSVVYWKYTWKCSCILTIFYLIVLMCKHFIVLSLHITP
jgi:hypothetical protein